MTRETKIALLVGLGFIICFGVILGESRIDDLSEAPDVVSLPTERDPPDLPTIQLQVPLAAESLSQPESVPPPADGSQDRAEPPGAWTPTGQGPDEGAPSAIGEATAPAPAARTYAVVAGDSLWKIARVVYGLGNERMHKRIFQANRDKLASDSDVHPGQILVIPPLPSALARDTTGSTVGVDTEQLRGYLGDLSASQRTAGPGRGGGRPAGRRTYKVKRGDNLTAIARRVLKDGSSAAVARLYRANRDKLASPHVVPVGVVLVMPE